MNRKLRMLITAVLTVAMLIGTGISVFAETDKETGKEVYSDLPAIKYVKDDGSLTIIEYYGGNTYKTLVIPNAIGDPVSEIRSEAFLGADPKTISAVYVPDTLMKIGENAFRKGMRIVVYRSGDYREFSADGQRTSKDPDVSKLTVKADSLYGETIVDNGVQYRLDGIEVTVVGYEGSGGEVRIAPSVGEIPVTTVASGALTDPKITKLFLPSNVTSVEENAVGAVEVVFRADSTNPVIPTVVPDPTEPDVRPVEIGTADIGTFDMSLGEFVTTEPAETKPEDETETGEDGSKGETEEASGEKDPEESAEENAPGSGTEPGKGQSSADGETEPADRKEDGKGASPWLFVGIGAAAVGLGIGATLFVRESLKRKRRHKNRKG